MVIEKEKLISLLAKKTGLEREQAEVQLAELVDRIQKAGGSGKPFLIEGFGTFNSSDGNLQFVPANRLETEINHKYAGMKPIELIGAFKESDTGEIPASDEVETKKEKIAWTFDEQAAEAGEKEFASVEADAKDAEEIKNGEKTKENQEKDTKEEPEPALSVASPENGESHFESTSQTSSSKKGSEKKAATTTSELKTDSLSQVLTGIIILLVFGAAGWFIYDLGFRDDPNTEPNSQPSSPPPTGQQQAPATEPPLDNQTPDLEPSVNSDTKENQVQADAESSEPEQNSSVSTEEQAGGQSESEQPYGLMGDVNSNISSGYMIVLHSRRRIDLARENKQELEEAGYRTIINRANVNGQEQYRVGVGQFKTIENALQAINKLPEPYKSNNFIKRIR